MEYRNKKIFLLFIVIVFIAISCDSNSTNKTPEYSPPMNQVFKECGINLSINEAIDAAYKIYDKQFPNNEGVVFGIRLFDENIRLLDENGEWDEDEEWDENKGWHVGLSDVKQATTCHDAFVVINDKTECSGYETAKRPLSLEKDRNRRKKEMEQVAASAMKYAQKKYPEKDYLITGMLMDGAVEGWLISLRERNKEYFNKTVTYQTTDKSWTYPFNELSVFVSFDGKASDWPPPGVKLIKKKPAWWPNDKSTR